MGAVALAGGDSPLQAGRSVKSLHKSLPILASLIGGRFGVRVRWNQPHIPTAATNGKEIVVSMIDEDDPEAAALLLGYIVHESYHLKYTDFGVNRPNRKLIWGIYQALEDARIECEGMKVYPGGADTIHRLVEVLVKRGVLFSEPRSDNQPGHLIQALALYGLRAHVVGQSALNDFADKAKACMDKSMPGLSTLLLAKLFEVRDATCTQDCLDIAHDCEKLIEDYLEQKQEEQQQQQDSQQGDGSPSDGDSDGAQASDGSDSATDDDNEGGSDAGSDSDDSSDSDDDSSNGAGSDSDDDGDQGGDSSGDQQSGDSDDTDSGSKGSDSLDETIKAVQDALDDDDLDSQDLGDAVSDEIEQEARDAYERGATPSAPFSENDGQYVSGTQSVDAQDVLVATGGLRARLTGLIQTKTQRRDRLGRVGTRLSDRALVRLRFDDPRVFLTRRDKQAVDTAVHILCDGSISMADDNRMEIAMQACFATAKALEGIRNASREVTRFPWGAGVQSVTRYGESTAATAHRYLTEVHGGTPMTEALWYVATRLVPRPEPKKLLFVITDGQPADRGGVVDILERMRASGVEAFGIGIATNACDGLFQRHCRIDNVGQLPGVLTNLVVDHFG